MIFISKNKINKKFFLIFPKKVKKNFQNIYSPIYFYENKKYEKILIGNVENYSKNKVERIFKENVKAWNSGNGIWPKLSSEKRIKFMKKFFTELRKKRNEISKSLMWEICKNEKDSYGEFDRTEKYFFETIKHLKKIKNKNLNIDNLNIYEKKSPIGISLICAPYNYPYNETFALLIPCLLMGNVAIVKPPKRGSLIYYNYIEKIAKKIFPKGVLTFVYGSGKNTIKEIIKNEEVSILGFIGRHKTANEILSYHPKQNKLKKILGLDAKNIAVVLKDCDIKNTISQILLGAFSFGGQRCTSIKLVCVDKKIKEIFEKKLKEEFEKITFGLPFENKMITPIIDENINYYNKLILDAVNKKSRLYFFCEDEKSFFSPKILFDVKSNMRIFNEEQFGPILPINYFSKIEEVEKIFSQNEFGQQASIFFKNNKEGFSLIEYLENHVGRININSQCQRGPDILPFNGRKNSAFETLSVSDSLNVFSIKSLITIDKNKLNNSIIKKLK